MPVPLSLNTITPIPSAKLSATYNGFKLSFTLDSGATVSFIAHSFARKIKAPIGPNGQYAQLAIPAVRAQSLGEIDIVVIECTTGKICLRLRALVMPSLSVPVYAGRTFEHDNGILDYVSARKVTVHHGRFTIDLSEQIGPLPPPRPPPFLTVQTASALSGLCQLEEKAVQVSLPLQHSQKPVVPPGSSSTTPSTAPPCNRNPPISQACTPVVMKEKAYVLPQGLHSIPCNLPQGSKVLVLPPSHVQPTSPTSLWPPQVCEIALGSALYVNNTDAPLYHGKNTHFRLVPMEEKPVTSPISCPVDLLALATAPSPTAESVLSQMQINREILSPDQISRLDSLHKQHLSAFNDDMSGGFQDQENPYYASFSFKDENRAPPHKVWAPQFTRKCQDLLQSKCDELEGYGILTDPTKHNEDVRLIHSIFIQQKGRAKHKALDQCALDEIRLISCFNSLNDSIHPIPGRSSAYNDLLKFEARNRYTIHADLTNSYFQVKVHKKFWKYMGVMTPYRGIRVFTRLGQGLLNSDVHLEQVVTRVLGDQLLEGKCIIARDDLIVGGKSIEECLANWAEILPKMNSHNLKLNPKKVRILLQDHEIYGHRVCDGKVRPSDHIVTSLAATSTENLVTVRQVNSWKGLYKTLIRHLPHLASLMAPFDAACAARPSSDKFDWSKPGMLAAFNMATKHLDKVMETYLPHPDEQLALKPDTSDVNLCTGWVLYTQRKLDEGTVWLPVQFASAKLHKYMENWTPCEQEGVGVVLAIEQVRHWVNESSKPTLVLPDNKPVVEAANLMKKGRHSKNPRLQSLLASVNRSNITFSHNSAKAGLHIVPDTLSRLKPMICTSKDCQVERFLQDIPARVELMPLTLEKVVLASLDPVQLAASAGDMRDLFSKGSGPIPLGSRQTWISLQADCEDCCKFLLCKRLGQVPGRKDKNKATVNRLLKTCEVSNGLIVSRTFDSTLMKEITKVYVPSLFLSAILTVMHVRLLCPLPTQLQRMFEKYFIGFGVQGLCNSISEECYLCSATRRFPKELDEFSPSSSIDHPGSHMNTDVMKRTSQNVVVTCDRFSNYVTATIVESESRENMVKAILTTVTPIRHAAEVEVRTDRARALQSLADRPDQQLTENGIKIVLGDHANPNSNCSVDKVMRELEEEIRKIDPGGTKLSQGELSRAVTVLNGRIRGHGLSASQLHFSRDQFTGKNLTLKDQNFKQVREERRCAQNQSAARAKTPSPTSISPGQLVYIKSEGSKHTARDPLVVTSVQGKMVTGQKMLRATPAHPGLPKITSDRMRVDRRFLSAPRPQPTCRSDSDNWRADTYSSQRGPPEAPQLSLRPSHPFSGSKPNPQAKQSPWDDDDKDDGVVYMMEGGRGGNLEELEAIVLAGRQQPQMVQGQVGGAEEEVQVDVVEEVQEEAAMDLDQRAGHVELEEIGGEAGDGEVHGPEVEAFPPLLQAQLARIRRRVDWGRGGQLVDQGGEDQAQEGQQLQQQPQPVVLQEEMAAQIQNRGITRGGRPTKAPSWYGIEKERGEGDEVEDLNVSNSLAQRDATPGATLTASTPNLSPVGTPIITPITTPDTSPDKSVIYGRQPWELSPNKAQGRTKKQRQENVMERHRHLSDPGPGVRLKHPAFADWDPGPRGGLHNN